MSDSGAGWKPGHASLSAYLDDHLLGAETGVRLFHAARRTWAGSEYEQSFADLEQEISHERDELEQLILTLGYRRSTFKKLLAMAGAAAGRLGPINPLGTGGGTSGQFELETLQSIVRAKECLWRTLLAFGRPRPPVQCLPTQGHAGNGRPAAGHRCPDHGGNGSGQVPDRSPPLRLLAPAR